MSDRKLYVGATAHCTIYIDQDDIRHLARISGNQSQVHVNWQTAVAAGFGKLVAQPALLEAYVEAVIARPRISSTMPAPMLVSESASPPPSKASLALSPPTK